MREMEEMTMTTATLTLDDILGAKFETGRNSSQIRTLRELHARYGLAPVNIVETGTIRCPQDSFRTGDGWSTLTWKLWAEATSSRVWTVDIDPNAIQICRAMTQESRHIDYICGDSIEFLKSFDRKIHLLFLDSFDSGPPGSAQVKKACHHQMLELQAAWRKLDDNALILLDDVPQDYRNGKGELTVPFLERHGWTMINWAETQALFARV